MRSGPATHSVRGRAGIRAGTCLVLLALTFLAVPGRGAGISFQEGSPRGGLLLSRPTIRWRCRATGGARIVSTQLSLNGRGLPSSYSQQELCVLARPDQPLAPGEYRVTCRVVLEPGGPFERDWRFQVLDGAVPEPPAPTDAALATLSAVNSLRRPLDLPPLRMDARLSAAAVAHERFRELNPDLEANAHYQSMGRPGFIGTRPSDRAHLFGFAFARIEEGIGVGDTPEDVVRGLWNAPYHRLPIVDTRNREFGAGIRERRDPRKARLAGTLMYGTEASVEVERERLVIVPREGEQDVPPSWLALEQPDPLRLHAIGGTRPARTGFPITACYFSPGDEDTPVRLIEANLKPDAPGSAPVALLPNTPERDEHLGKNQLILIPRQPLAPATPHRLSLTLRTPAGKELRREIRFITAAAERP